MIDAKKAVQIAMEQAANMLAAESSLEEIERDTHKGREVWSITLSLPRKWSAGSAISELTRDPLQYKRFLIDVETGELVAMTIREFAGCR